MAQDPHQSGGASSVVVSAVRQDEAESIAQLAGEIWRRHYPGIISAAQIEYMLDQRYDSALIRSELARGTAWWDKIVVANALAGFASYFFSGEPGEMKLDKLYVHPDHQRRGYGAQLVAHVATRARSLGCGRLMLAVNRHNAQAIAAYRNYGFTVRTTRTLEIGAGFVMDDYIMVREL